jgi:biopolymer transport protein ExbB
MFFKEMMQQGGPAMYPLLLLSVLAWFILIERVIYLVSFDKLRSKLKELFSKKDQASNETAFKDLTFELRKLLVSIKGDQNQSRDQLESKANRCLEETQMALKGRLWVLATIATIAPFIGLFGTVTGIMQSFDDNYYCCRYYYRSGSGYLL